MFGFSFDKTMEEVKQELDAGKDIQLIDVRETDEYRDGHIPGADHLALSELEDRAAAVVGEREAALSVLPQRAAFQDGIEEAAGSWL